MMDCKQLQSCIDDYLDGILPAGEQNMAEKHLAECADCRAELNQIQELRHALRGLPVPAPTADFSSRVLATARQRHAKKQRRVLGGLVTAMAASLVMWVGVTLYHPTSEQGSVEAIVMSVSETRKVSLVFNAPDNFNKVSMQLELSGNIELDGYKGRRDLKWQTALKKGANTLVLPIKATGLGKAEVTARIKHGGKTRVFHIPLKVDSTGAELKAVELPVSV